LKLTRQLIVASMLAALVISGCGEDTQAAGAAGGDGGAGGVDVAPKQVCTLGLCTDDQELAAECLEGYGACVGRGESPASCGMEADGDCGVFPGVGGSGGEPYIVCTLGLCMDDAELSADCFDVYDECIGRGHYARSCRMESDMTCGVFGETGPY
jgi:hypothetical protein